MLRSGVAKVSNSYAERAMASEFYQNNGDAR